jgi:hypothetical protein
LNFPQLHCIHTLRSLGFNKLTLQISAYILINIRFFYFLIRFRNFKQRSTRACASHPNPTFAKAPAAAQNVHLRSNVRSGAGIFAKCRKVATITTPLIPQHP